MLATGADGRTLAVSRLEGQGYKILARGFDGGYATVDLVARDGRYLVFVRVRREDDPKMGYHDWQRFVRAAAEYVALKGWWHFEARFDEVEVGKGGEIRHRKGAF